jgi:hypothetical protein
VVEWECRGASKGFDSKSHRAPEMNKCLAKADVGPGWENLILEAWKGASGWNPSGF